MSAIMLPLLYSLFTITSGDSPRQYSMSFEDGVMMYHEETSKLYHFLFDNYKKDLPSVFTMYHLPNLPFRDPTRMVVNVTLLHTRLLTLDQLEQQIGMNFDIRYEWKDARLEWVPEDFKGIDKILVPSDTVWQPDTVIYDSSAVEDNVPSERQMVKINDDGIVILIKSFSFKVVCLLDMSDFPFDVQHCSVRIKSFSFTKQELGFNVFVEKADGNRSDMTRGSYGNGEWNLLDTDVKVREAMYPEPHGTEDLITEEVEVIFTFKRHSIYYLSVMIIPCFIISVLSVFGMFYHQTDDPSNQIKWLSAILNQSIIHNFSLFHVVIGLTTLMSMAVVLGIVADATPKTQKVPIIVVHIMVDIAICAFATILVMLMKKTEERKMKNSSIFITIISCLSRKNVVAMIILELLLVCNLLILTKYA